MQSREIFILIVCLAALFAYINARFIKLQQTIGIVVLSILFSIFVMLAGSFFPFQASKFVHIVPSIDFHNLLMNGMLSFLLFAGSIHINSINLKSEGLANNNVYSIAEDKRGNLWFGTSEGLSVMSAEVAGKLPHLLKLRRPKEIISSKHSLKQMACRIILFHRYYKCLKEKWLLALTWVSRCLHHQKILQG